MLDGATAALNSLEAAYKSRPFCPQIRSHYASTLVELGAATRDKGLLKRAMFIDPENAKAHQALAAFNLSSVKEGQISASSSAEISLQKATYHLELARLLSRSSDASILADLGSVYRQLGWWGPAVECFERAVGLHATPRLLCCLGALYAADGAVDQGIALARRAVAEDPLFAEGWNNLGIFLRDAGLVEEAVDAFSRATQIDPDNIHAPHSLLMSLNYLDLEISTVIQAHTHWGTQVVKKAKAVGKLKERTADISRDALAKSPIRVGFLSPDLRAHSVSYFLEGFARFQSKNGDFNYIWLHDSVEREDYKTILLRDLVGGGDWIGTGHLNEGDLLALLESLNLDILVDLAGHSGNNRLRVFACKPAKISVSYLGYPNTTGLPNMDYRLVDYITDPFDCLLGQPEKLIRFSKCFLCYTPWAGLKDNTWKFQRDDCRLCQDARKPFTFGSFNTLAKLTPRVLNLWVRVLDAVPDSILVLKSKALASPSVAARYTNLHPRIRTLPMTKDTVSHLHCYTHIDVALDSHPYGGTTTTCEALVCGVPVITLGGSLASDPRPPMLPHAQRVSASILKAVGIDNLTVATDEEDYIQKAVNLASERNGLVKQWKDGDLLKKVLESSLCDAEAHTRELEQIFKQILETS